MKSHSRPADNAFMQTATVPLTIASQAVKAPGRPMTDAEQKYNGWLETLRKRYLNYPMHVGLETLARCNAKCHFCPYPNMKRKGDRMGDELITKVLNDLRDIPSDIPFQINFTRVNEPFLDKRIVDVMREANRLLPHAKLSIYTNGSAFTPALLDKLAFVEQMDVFNISLNSHDPEQYRKIMQLPFERTVANIDMLYDRVVSGAIKFSVALSRIADRSEADQEFADFVQKRWPRFRYVLSDQVDWIGTVDVPQVAPIPRISCVQWFRIHLLASGRDTLCAIDHDASHGFGSVTDTHILDLYNHPARLAQRECITERRNTSPCKDCAYWG